jgi:hypothetical protein
MNVLGRTLRGVLGLFIDDGKLALTIVALLLVTALLTRLDSFDGSLAMVLLVAGTIGALLANVVHAASATKRLPAHSGSRSSVSMVLKRGGLR